MDDGGVPFVLVLSSFIPPRKSWLYSGLMVVNSGLMVVNSGLMVVNSGL